LESDYRTRHTHNCSFFWSGVFGVRNLNERYALRQRRDVHSKNLSWRSSLSVERGCRGCVFQAIDDSIHHALLLMRLGFVFDFAYKKYKIVKKPENRCRSFSLHCLSKTAVLMAL
jgi:hypothetical protein